MKKLFFLFMFVILFIGLASATLKSYDADTKTVTLSSNFLFINTGDIATVTLLTPLNNRVGLGYQEVARLQVNGFTDYKDFISQLEFYDIKNGMAKFNREYDLKVKGTEQVLVNDYGTRVKTTLSNGTNIYESYISGSHYETRDTWTKLTPADLKKDDNLIIGIFTEVQLNDKVEWIPTIAGVQIEEWATWTADLNVGLVSYYKFEGNYVDSVNASSPLTNQGTVNSSGIVGSGIDTTGTKFANRTFGAIPVGSSALTVCVWDYPTATSPNSALFGMGSASNGQLFTIGNDGTKYVLAGYYGDAYDTGDIATNQWNFVCGVQVDSTNRQLWVNGLNVDNETYSTYNIGTTYKPHIGLNAQNPLDHAGKIDEVGIWNRALSTAEIVQLYNSGVGMTYTTTFGGISIDLNSPANAYKTNNTNVTLNWTITPTDVNITNYTLNIYYANGTLAHSHTDTGMFGSDPLTVIHNDILFVDEQYTWGVISCGNKTTGEIFCGSSVNRTFQVHTTSPEITVTSPTGNQGLGYVGKSLTLNWTATDPEIDKCWYNYNGTNILVTCGDNTTTFAQDTDDYNLTFYANDTFGNSDSASTSWTYNLFQNSITYNVNTIEGSSEVITLNMTTNGTDINYAYLMYNSMPYLATLTKNGNNYLLSNTISIPLVTVDGNKTFYYSITQDGENTNTSIYNQTILNLLIDDCSSYTYKIFDLYLRDEESNVNITNLTIETYVDVNSTMETEINIYSQVDLTSILNYSKLYYNKNPASICLNINLSNSNYYLDSIFKYFAEPYAQEYYHIQRYNLTSLTLYQNITLYDLLLSKSTEFQVTLLSNAYSPIADALIIVNKKYVSEGVFKTVEIAKTDSDGKTVIHLDEKDATYNIYAYKNGVLITSYTNVVAVCQDILTGTCTITLRQASSSSSLFNATADKRITYDFSYNSGTKILTMTFNSINSTLYNVSIESYIQTEVGNSFLCSNSAYSASGVLTCDVVGAVGKSSVVTFIYVDGDLIDVEVINIDSTGIFSTTGYFIFFLLIVTTIFMFSGSKSGMIIGAIIGLVASGYLGIIEGGKFGLGSAIIWVVIAGVILLYKLNSNGGSH